MPFSVAGQFVDLLWAILVGVGLGVLYDVFRLWRVMHHGKISVFLQDVLWWMLFAFLSFYFALFWQGGVVRWYTLAGEIIGFWLYHKTIGKLVFFLCEKILKLILWVLRLIMQPLRWLFHLLMKPIRHIFRKEKEILKNLFIFLKERIIIKKRKRHNAVAYAERGWESGEQKKEKENRFSH